MMYSNLCLNSRETVPLSCGYLWLPVPILQECWTSLQQCWCWFLWPATSHKQMWTGSTCSERMTSMWNCRSGSRLPDSNASKRTKRWIFGPFIFFLVLFNFVDANYFFTDSDPTFEIISYLRIRLVKNNTGSGSCNWRIQDISYINTVTKKNSHYFKVKYG